MEKLITEAEVIYGIPDEETYNKLFDIFQENGYRISGSYKPDGDYNEWPNITLFTDQICGNKTIPPDDIVSGSTLKGRKFTHFSDFMNRLEEENHEKEWRENLSDLFNKKVGKNVI